MWIDRQKDEASDKVPIAFIARSTNNIELTEDEVKEVIAKQNRVISPVRIKDDRRNLKISSQRAPRLAHKNFSVPVIATTSWPKVTFGSEGPAAAVGAVQDFPWVFSEYIITAMIIKTPTSACKSEQFTTDK
ncbi:hypothetical protein MA16_Dca026316 [Dendrobium catenatum]|uniref:Uncharacterized protein n=1 Tax=Dendrobium catenatum TaxID=906689 RepID=A0A2I0VEI7_9ASPA|nr:hypothetical protein MA16_Dca026316 [Dendrobium catenatum]